MRRRAIRLFSLVSIALASATGIVSVGAQQASLDSGALGASRTEIEAEWGRATELIDVPGHPSYDETYAYPGQNGTFFVTYRELNGDEIAIYVEFAWSGRGATEQQARAVGERLLPADAELTGFYVAPPTAAGPIALVTQRYESERLGTHLTLPPDILVIYQERWGDVASLDATSVQAVSLMIREPTQATG